MRKGRGITPPLPHQHKHDPHTLNSGSQWIFFNIYVKKIFDISRSINTMQGIIDLLLYSCTRNSLAGMPDLLLYHPCVNAYLRFSPHVACRTVHGHGHMRYIYAKLIKGLQGVAHLCHNVLITGVLQVDKMTTNSLLRVQLNSFMTASQPLTLHS